jgi:hypothetical protein
MVEQWNLTEDGKTSLMKMGTTALEFRIKAGVSPVSTFGHGSAAAVRTIISVFQ